jgi:hypothetical protein
MRLPLILVPNPRIAMKHPPHPSMRPGGNPYGKYGRRVGIPAISANLSLCDRSARLFVHALSRLPLEGMTFAERERLRRLLGQANRAIYAAQARLLIAKHRTDAG